MVNTAAVHPKPSQNRVFNGWCTSECWVTYLVPTEVRLVLDHCMILTFKP